MAIVVGGRLCGGRVDERDGSLSALFACDDVMVTSGLIERFRTESRPEFSTSDRIPHVPTNYTVFIFPLSIADYINVRRRTHCIISSPEGAAWRQSVVNRL